MYAKYKFDRWQVAYRMPGMPEFKVIPNPEWGWAADPFLVEYEGVLYLFAELFLYASERNGVIGYCKYNNDGFGEWIVSMDRHWHLSYPNIFVYQNKLYMCPESYQENEVAIYQLVDFPDHWKKVKTLLQNVKCVDSTFFCYEGTVFFFTYEQQRPGVEGDLILYRIEFGELVDRQVISSDISRARPGGNILCLGDRRIRVSQDSSKGYGSSLVFSEIISLYPKYEEQEIKHVSPEDIKKNGKEKYLGVHTYNCYNGVEVIDLKYRKLSIREYIARNRVRKVFCNKYSKSKRKILT